MDQLVEKLEQTHRLEEEELLALLRSHTVYVTPENACQLQEIMRTALTWL